MRGEHLGDSAGAALFISLNALEESYVGVRVVSGFVHVLQAKEIGLALGVTPELEGGDGDGKVQALIEAVPGPATRTGQNQRVAGNPSQFAPPPLLRPLHAASA